MCISRGVRALTDSPDFKVTAFALLLTFAWEALQAGLCIGIPDTPHAQATRACRPGTAREAVIGLPLLTTWLVRRQLTDHVDTSDSDDTVS